MLNNLFADAFSVVFYLYFVTFLTPILLFLHVMFQWMFRRKRK